MQPVSFTVPGEPRAWARARIRVLPGGHARHFMDNQTRSYESLVKMAAQDAMGDRPLIDEPCSCTIIVRKVPPSSASRVRRADMMAGTIRPGTKPDGSNLAKGIEDALNGIVWRDDALVCDLTVSKYFAEAPGVTVYIGPPFPAPVAPIGARQLAREAA